ncbi:hypothetical protein [Nostoc sp.]|uniref:hypothetical protein n=1 Tax=Nostoc sp. TaxID=1180 RepID=UPI002FF769BF
MTVYDSIRFSSSQKPEKCDPLDHILPTTERQVRPMTWLEPHEQQEVWLTAVEVTGGKVPTARIVKDVVQRIM